MGILAVVTLPHTSGQVREAVTNSFAFGGAGASLSSSDEDILMAAVTAAYNVIDTAGGQTANLAAYLGRGLSRAASACIIRLYDITAHLDGSPHGSPFRSGAFTLGAANEATSMPEEVAYAVTLEASGRALQRVEVPDGTDPDLKPDRPKQRYTGKVYFGPFTMNSNGTGASPYRSVPQVQTLCRSAIGNITGHLETYLDGVWLGVWSRKDEIIREIDKVSSDDAWDTQRRRGITPSVRTSQAVVGAGSAVELAA